MAPEQQPADEQDTRAARVALIVDNPARDLAGMALLGGHLACAGFTVQLVPMNLRERELPALDPDLVVVNYVRKANQELLARLMAMGTAVGLLDTEGGVGIIGRYANITDHYGNIMADDVDVRNGIRFVCAWGPRVGEYSVDKGWYRADQVAITGPPRFDWYHPSLRQAALAASSEVEEAGDDFVLVIGSFPAANPQFRSAEIEMANRAKFTGYDRSVVDELRDRDVEAMNATTDLVRRLATEHPDTRFVFRPHPFERAETYVELFDTLPNVVVSRQGTVDGWVLRCRATIAPNDCTVAIECAMAGVPALLTDWIVPENRVEVVMAAGEPHRSPDDLAAALSAVLDGSRPADDPERRRRAEQAVTDWFFHSDGQAHRRVGELIATEMTIGRRSPAARRRMHYVRAGVPALSSGGIQDRLRALFRLPARFSFRSMRPADGLRWDDTPKAYSLSDLKPFVDALNTYRFFGDHRIMARPAQPGRDYAFGYEGRAIVFEAVPAHLSSEPAHAKPESADH